MLGTLLGLAVGAWLWRPEAPIPEVAAPEERRPDGSVVLERAPDAPVRGDHALPAGGTLEREVTIVVRPDPVPRNPAIVPVPVAHDTGSAAGVPRETPAVPACECLPVTVRLSLVRLEDGSRRVIASAEGGRILQGVDVPVDPPGPVARPLRWAVGPQWDPHSRRIGGFVDRDFDRVWIAPVPVRLGLSAVPQPAGATFGIRVGLRF